MKHNKLIKLTIAFFVSFWLCLFLLAISARCDEEPHDISEDRAITMPEYEEPIVVQPVTIEENLPNEAEIDMLAKLVWGEARGLTADEQALVVFCVFNRIDDERFPSTITEVITQNKPCVQFEGYSSSYPIEEDIRDICVECYNVWVNNLENPLPSRFVFFHAENGHNVFTTKWNGGEKWVYQK